MVTYQVVAVQVIVMGMGEQQTHGAQALGLDETNQAFTLATLVHAAVDDNGLPRLIIPNDVRALSKHVCCYFKDLNHISIIIRQSHFAGANIRFLSELERRLDEKCVFLIAEIIQNKLFDLHNSN